MLLHYCGKNNGVALVPAALVSWSALPSVVCPIINPINEIVLEWQLMLLLQQPRLRKLFSPSGSDDQSDKSAEG